MYALKLYIKQHIKLFLGCLLVVLFTAYILSLTKVVSFSLLVYFFVVCSFLFLVLFSYDYYTKYELYRFLSNQTTHLLAGDKSQLSQQTKRKLDERLHEEEKRLLLQTKRQEQQINFMNLWTHQMKTPLSVLEMMAQNNQLTSQSVLIETQRLKNGLNIALNEARLSNDFQKDFMLTNFSLKEIVTDAINTQKTNFIQSKVFPAVTISDDCFVTSDAKWVSFMIEQILTNSLKYSLDATKIDLRTVVTDEHIQLQIEDYGIGIPASDLPRVRGTFFTGENGRKYGEATGMGLFLVNQLIDELDLEWTIESVVNQGTCVTILFPRQSI